jgi:hypothetical protein
MEDGMIFDSTTKKNENHRLYYRSMGKIFRVIGIAENDDEANRFCARKDNWPNQHGVIGVTGEGHVVIAEFHGEKIQVEK